MKFSHWPIYYRVLVNLLDGRAFDGLLVSKRGPLLELADVHLFSAPGGSEPAELDGRVFVERSQVAFIQVRPEKGV